MKYITLDEVENKFTEVAHMSSKPDKEKFHCYNKNKELVIIDEDKSVRWNKEEVARRNAEYDAEVKRLHEVVSKAVREAHLLAKSYITQETGMNDAQASIYWEYIYAEYHAYIGDLISHLEELTDLYNQVQEAATKKGA